MNEAFVYCWTDLATSRLYVGYHKGAVDDGYICSSKELLVNYKSRPHDFVRSIVATGDPALMRAFEETILRTVDAKNDDNFYNRSNGGQNFYCASHRAETKARIGASQRGKPRPNAVTEEARRKMSEAGKRKSFTAEHRAKNSAGVSNLRWVNNGVINKRIPSQESIPEGFVSGRMGMPRDAKGRIIKHGHQTLV